MIQFYISLGFNVLFAVLLIGAVYLLNRAGQAINNYEAFFQQTIVSLEQYMQRIKSLIDGNILSDDDNVQAVFKSIKGSYKILSGYTNAGNGSRQPKQELLRQRN